VGNLLPGNFDECIVESQLRRAPAEALGEIAQLKAFLAGARGRFEEGRRDLVMGFATGYTPEAVRPFVESLLTAGRFRGEVVLFIGRSDVELAEYLGNRRIRAARFEVGSTSYGSVVMARWFSYWDFLTARLEEGQIYRNILLTDVRDVIFQKPLFERRAEELEFHLEAGPKIGQCSWNSAGIRITFGEEVLARMAERRISCAGVVTGRTSGILRYLAWMKILILSLSEERRSQGIDQPIHNFVLYNGLLEEARVLENFRRVATLHYVPATQIRVNDEAALVNPDGSICEIAHQWDRHPAFAAQITAKAEVRFIGEIALIQQLTCLKAMALAQGQEAEHSRQQLAQMKAMADAQRQEAEHSRQQLAQMKAMADAQRQEAEHLQRQMSEVFDSTSWRLIHPIHQLVGGRPGLRRILRGIAYFGWWVRKGRSRS
jgi:hypothetical protein